MIRVMYTFWCDPTAVGSTGLPIPSAICQSSLPISLFSRSLFFRNCFRDSGMVCSSNSPELLCPRRPRVQAVPAPARVTLVGCGQRRAQRRCEATGRRVPGTLQPSCYPETGEEKTRLQPAGTRSTATLPCAALPPRWVLWPGGKATVDRRADRPSAGCQVAHPGETDKPYCFRLFSSRRRISCGVVCQSRVFHAIRYATRHLAGPLWFTTTAAATTATQLKTRDTKSSEQHKQSSEVLHNRSTFASTDSWEIW